MLLMDVSRLAPRSSTRRASDRIEAGPAVTYLFGEGGEDVAAVVTRARWGCWATSRDGYVFLLVRLLRAGRR